MTINDQPIRYQMIVPGLLVADQPMLPGLIVFGLLAADPGGQGSWYDQNSDRQPGGCFWAPGGMFGRADQPGLPFLGSWLPDQPMLPGLMVADGADPGVDPADGCRLMVPILVADGADPGVDPADGLIIGGRAAAARAPGHQADRFCGLLAARLPAADPIVDPAGGLAVFDPGWWLMAAIGVGWWLMAAIGVGWWLMVPGWWLPSVWAPDGGHQAADPTGQGSWLPAAIGLMVATRLPADPGWTYGSRLIGLFAWWPGLPAGGCHRADGLLGRTNGWDLQFIVTTRQGLLATKFCIRAKRGK